MRLLTLLLLEAKFCVHGLNYVSNKGEYLDSLLSNGQPFASAHGKVICCILSGMLAAVHLPQLLAQQHPRVA